MTFLKRPAVTKKPFVNYVERYRQAHKVRTFLDKPPAWEASQSKWQKDLLLHLHPGCLYSRLLLVGLIHMVALLDLSLYL